MICCPLDPRGSLCGCSVLSGPFGTLLSPNYPDNYSTSLTCVWRLVGVIDQVSEPSNYILINRLSSGVPLLTWINFNSRIDKWLHPFYEGAWLRLSGVSQMSCNIWGCVCFQLNRLWWWSEYDLIFIKSEVGIISHCLWLGHETMVCTVCLAMFYVL